MNSDVGPKLWRSSATVKSPWPLLQRGNPNLAEGDPLPIFLKFFYNNEVGKEASEARAGSRAPFFRARSRSGHKIGLFENRDM